MPADNSFERDVRAAWTADVWQDDEHCRDFWSALANVDWYNIKTNSVYGYSFRGAGSLIAALRGSGDYMDWYCSGPYATVSNDIARHLKKFGWIADTLGDICDEPGCYVEAGCGWPSAAGYRRTCGEHDKGTLTCG